MSIYKKKLFIYNIIIENMNNNSILSNNNSFYLGQNSILGMNSQSLNNQIQQNIPFNKYNTNSISSQSINSYPRQNQIGIQFFQPVNSSNIFSESGFQPINNNNFNGEIIVIIKFTNSRKMIFKLNVNKMILFLQ